MIGLFCAAAVIASPAQNTFFVSLLSFLGADGIAPSALVQANDGNFYGTTLYGGAFTNNCSPYGCGTVFKITPAGTVTTLYSFCPQPNCLDGAKPRAALVQATEGSFYGTTEAGGGSNYCNPPGCGTVFRITPGGALITLHRFEGTDGDYPNASLVQATDGNFYGTTLTTVFKITPSGTLTTLVTQLYYPSALIQASDGNFYGTTPLGGANCSPSGCGTVFKVTPTGELTTLYSFCSQPNCTDGWHPNAGLVQGSDGNLYGTTFGGGTNDDCNGYEYCGTVFKITLSPLYS